MPGSDELLRLSRYAQPQVRVGVQRIFPQNLTPGPERVAYVEGLVVYLNEMIDEAERGVISIESVFGFLRSLPFGQEWVEVVALERRFVARVREGALDEIRMDTANLGLVFLDGRLRRLDEMVYLRTGAATASVGRLMPPLVRGTTRRELLRLAVDYDAPVADELVDELIAGGILVASSPPDSPRSEAPRRARDRLTWLGHAAAIFQSPGATIWVDPSVRPPVAWRDEELETVFSNDFADSVLVEGYGPDAKQLAIGELPPPDAVLITHQDADHFDLGVLMCVPENVPIVVPRPQPGRPWDVDLADVIRRVLGPTRKVVPLGHGESLRVKDATVTAIPLTGEYPPSLPHSWNTYIVDGADSSAVFLADCAVSPVQIDAIAAHASANPGRPITVLSYVPYDQPAEGQVRRFTEGLEVLHNLSRLWPWYMPPWGHFSTDMLCGIAYGQIAELARRANVRNYFVYSVGSTPAARVTAEPLSVLISSLSKQKLESVRDQTRAAGVHFLELRYGVPYELAKAGAEVAADGAARSG